MDVLFELLKETQRATSASVPLAREPLLEQALLLKYIPCDTK